MAGRDLMAPPFLTRYRQTFDATWSDDTSVDDVRFVVLDSETTGLNPRTDRLITIGAVAVRGGEILLDDAFDALIQVGENTSAVTVHGVTRDESRAGVAEPEALARFLDYLRDGVIVGHHIGHDVATFDAAYERHWGARLLNRSMDTMDLTLHLEKDGAFAGRPAIRRFTLDALSEMFGVIPHDRHTASGDAFITAQILLRLLKLAARHGRTTLAAVSQEFAVAGDTQ
ncbi:MAG TPA: 3'-5' exonuclease [Vicinamibacterales bacterium]|nr:3'-5' exonuclease [Vicinamibacterales bacterium]